MIDIFVNIGIVIAVFFFMEGVAWFTHKYIMHGALWTWHRSHHTVHPHPLERNDLFALVFSVPSIGLFYYSAYYSDSFYLTSVAIGILCYGIFYFIFHDVIVHRRIKIPFKATSQYMKRIMHAHYVHHEKHSKKHCEAFGFLYAPKKYEKQVKNA